MRTEFGVERSTCVCGECVTNCRYMPGFLIPADLERMIPPTAHSALKWAEDNLLASPGATAIAKGRIIHIPTLVPAVNSYGHCIHLTVNNRCNIHSIAPFGCAFFSCEDEVPGLSEKGLLEVFNAHHNRTLYHQIWMHLYSIGKRQLGPGELRKRMAQGKVI